MGGNGLGTGVLGADEVHPNLMLRKQLAVDNYVGTDDIEVDAYSGVLHSNGSGKAAMSGKTNTSVSEQEADSLNYIHLENSMQMSELTTSSASFRVDSSAQNKLDFVKSKQSKSSNNVNTVPNIQEVSFRQKVAMEAFLSAPPNSDEKERRWKELVKTMKEDSINGHGHQHHHSSHRSSSRSRTSSYGSYSSIKSYCSVKNDDILGLIQIGGGMTIGGEITGDINQEDGEEVVSMTSGLTSPTTSPGVGGLVGHFYLEESPPRGDKKYHSKPKSYRRPLFPCSDENAGAPSISFPSLTSEGVVNDTRNGSGSHRVSRAVFSTAFEGSFNGKKPTNSNTEGDLSGSANLKNATGDITISSPNESNSISGKHGTGFGKTGKKYSAIADAGESALSLEDDEAAGNSAKGETWESLLLDIEQEAKLTENIPKVPSALSQLSDNRMLNSVDIKNRVKQFEASKSKRQSIKPLTASQTKHQLRTSSPLMDTSIRSRRRKDLGSTGCSLEEQVRNVLSMQKNVHAVEDNVEAEEEGEIKNIQQKKKGEEAANMERNETMLPPRAVTPSSLGNNSRPKLRVKKGTVGSAASADDILRELMRSPTPSSVQSSHSLNSGRKCKPPLSISIEGGERNSACLCNESSGIEGKDLILGDPVSRTGIAAVCTLRADGNKMRAPTPPKALAPSRRDLPRPSRLYRRSVSAPEQEHTNTSSHAIAASNRPRSGLFPSTSPVTIREDSTSAKGSNAQSWISISNLTSINEMANSSESSFCTPQKSKTQSSSDTLFPESISPIAVELSTEDTSDQGSPNESLQNTSQEDSSYKYDVSDEKPPQNPNLGLPTSKRDDRPSRLCRGSSAPNSMTKRTSLSSTPTKQIAVPKIDVKSPDAKCVKSDTILLLVSPAFTPETKNLIGSPSSYGINPYIEKNRASTDKLNQSGIESKQLPPSKKDVKSPLSRRVKSTSIPSPITPESKQEPEIDNTTRQGPNMSPSSSCSNPKINEIRASIDKLKYNGVGGIGKATSILVRNNETGRYVIRDVDDEAFDDIIKADMILPDRKNYSSDDINVDADDIIEEESDEEYFDVDKIITSCDDVEGKHKQPGKSYESCDEDEYFDVDDILINNEIEESNKMELPTPHETHRPSNLDISPVEFTFGGSDAVMGDDAVDDAVRLATDGISDSTVSSDDKVISSEMIGLGKKTVVNETPPLLEIAGTPPRKKKANFRTLNRLSYENNSSSEDDGEFFVIQRPGQRSNEPWPVFREDDFNSDPLGKTGELDDDSDCFASSTPWDVDDDFPDAWDDNNEDDDFHFPCDYGITKHVSPTSVAASGRKKIGGNVVEWDPFAMK